MEWSDGASFEGEWNYGYAHGKGKLCDALGNLFEGDFYMSMAHGYGKYTNTEGSTYVGSWRFDK